jgi:hypothetical protein
MEIRLQLLRRRGTSVDPRVISDLHALKPRRFPKTVSTTQE